MIKESIEKYCNSLGLDAIGFIKSRKFEELRDFYKWRKKMSLENEFEEKDIEKRINPNIYMNEGKTIISIAFPYLWDKGKSNNGFSKYTKGIDYHRVVKSYLDNICTYIAEELNGNAVSLVDSNSLPERYIAYLSGVGFIGRNNMLITEKYGSYVFLGEIITDIDIDCEEIGSFDNILEYKQCGACNNCLKECPTKSINSYKINPNICSSYITQKKDITNKEMELLKGKVFGCDDCQIKCPYNESALLAKIDEFKPLEFMCDNDLKLYAGINNKFFKEKISKTSCGWRGKNVIKRNAIISLHNQGEDISMFVGESTYINDYVNILLKKDNM